MNVLYIASDGSCKNNKYAGTHSCASTGACVASDGYTNAVCEIHNSSSQRGELQAAIAALDYALSQIESKGVTEVQWILDSGYIHDGVLGRWYYIWKANGWKTSMGEPAKNIDLWEKLMMLVEKIQDAIDEDFVVLQIKSHVNLSPRAVVSYTKAKESFIKKNGFDVPDEIFREFVRLNTLADTLADQAYANLFE